MIVRIRLQRTRRPVSQVEIAAPEPAKEPDLVTWQEMAGGLATLLSPAAALCFALAFWRLGQDMGYARSFFITDGALSHWQVWFLGASFLLTMSQWLNRRARPDDDEPATS